MATTVDNAFVRTFEGIVRFLAQQSQNKLRGTTLEKGNGPGEDHVFEYVGPVEMSATAKTRRQATPEVDTPWTNRIVTVETFDVGDTVEKEDKLKMIIEPTSAISQNYSMAGRRKFDDIIIAATEANAIDKDGNVTALPAGSQLGDGTKEITLDALTEVAESFGKDEIDPDAEKFAVVTPTQVRKLMHDPKCTSRDYVAFQAIQAGKMPDQFMGFYWRITNRLRSAGAGTVNCLFYTRNAIGLKVDEDITTEIAKDPGKSFLWRVYARLTAGAVRIEDKQIRVYNFKNTVTLA